MIDWKSILSLYNGKTTLLQWLKKVEKALKDSALVSLEVSKNTPTAATLTLVFADGSRQTSSEFILPSAGQPEDIDEMNLTAGDSTVEYDTTDGLALENTANIKYKTYNKNVAMRITIPIKAGAGISIDKADDEEWLIIKNTNPQTTINGESGALTLKTFFGNQSLLGPGNVDIFMHMVSFKVLAKGSVSGYERHAKVVFYSSKNLVIDSLTDLKTVLGNTFALPAFYDSSDIFKTIPVLLDETGLTFFTGSDFVKYEFANITTLVISDVVTTI